MTDAWVEMRLDECLTRVQRPVSVASQSTVDFAGVRWYSEGVYHRSTEPASAVKTRILNRLEVGDITYNRMWASKAAFGVVGEDADGCLVTNDFPVFQVRGCVLPEWVGFVFETPTFQRKADLLAVGTTERRRLKEDAFGSIEVPVPPVSVQRRIVDLMGHLDAHLANLQTEHEAAGTQIRVLRDVAFASKGNKPARLVFDILMGRQRSPARATGPNMTPYLRAANVKDGYLDFSDVKEMDFDAVEKVKFGIRAGDVMVSEGSGSHDAVGACAQVGLLPSPVVCFQNTLLRYRAIDGVSRTGFVHHWCRWAYESGAFRDVATGTNILHIGAKRAAEMAVPDLTLSEQDRIVEHLDSWQDVARELGVELDRARIVRTEVLAALLGQDRAIPESYDEWLGVG